MKILIKTLFSDSEEASKTAQDIMAELDPIELPYIPKIIQVNPEKIKAR